MKASPRFQATRSNASRIRKKSPAQTSAHSPRAASVNPTFTLRNIRTAKKKIWDAPCSACDRELVGKPKNSPGNLDSDGPRPGACMRDEEMRHMLGDIREEDGTGGRQHDEWWRKVVGCCRLSNGRHTILNVHGTK